MSMKWFKLGEMFKISLYIFLSQLKFYLNDFSISWSSRISLSPSCNEVFECSASEMQQHSKKYLDQVDNNGVVWLLCLLHVSVHILHSSITASSSCLNFRHLSMKWLNTKKFPTKSLPPVVLSSELRPLQRSIKIFIFCFICTVGCSMYSSVKSAAWQSRNSLICISP